MIEIIPNWHPVFVHFTVALLAVAGLLYLIVILSGDWKYKQSALKVAEWNFWIGSAMTIVTALTGWYAYNTVAHDTPSHIAMTEHRNWALATLVVIAVLAIWTGRNRVSGGKLSLPFAALIAIMLGLLGSTAWHGGEVVYRHGLGVMSLPKSTGDGHDHAHGNGYGDDEKKSDKAKTQQDHNDGKTVHDHSTHKH